MSDARNLNPHAEAIMAMLIWGKRYSEQRGGSMDFWDSLSPCEHGFCRDQVDKIVRAKRASKKDKEQC